MKHMSRGPSEATRRDDYGHLSEHSHPNSACFQQYHDGDVPGGEIRFKEPTKGTLFPVVNWCLIDLCTLLLGIYCA